jgi:hypothetical protein
MRFLGLNISRDKGKATPAATTRRDGSAAKARPYYASPYVQALRNQVPLTADLNVYKVLREAIPCLDAAINWTVTLLGDVEIIADDPVREDIETWLKAVVVPPVSTGFDSWLGVHADSLLWSGKAVGEIVPNNRRKDVYALYNLESDSIVYQTVPGDPHSLHVCQTQNGQVEPVILDPYWRIVNKFGNTTSPHGKSLFHSLPFVCEILAVMENALKDSWERFGCPTYDVNLVLPDEFNDPDGTQVAAIMAPIKESFTEAMASRKTGDGIKDFFGANVEVSVIGADGQVLEIEKPYRVVAEQVVAATHLPPWMLGFTWSSTERLSQNQADLLTAYLDGIWAELYPEVFRIISTRQLLAGKSLEFDVKRKAMSLQDKVETARADLMKGQAESTRTKTSQEWWRLGYITQEQAAEHAIGENWDGVIARAMAEPPVVAMGNDGNNGEGNGKGSTKSPHVHSSGTPCGCESCKADDSNVSYGQGEEPSDQRIKDAIDGFYNDSKKVLADLETKCWTIFNLPNTDDRSKIVKADEAFTYTEAQLKVFDEAIDIFLREMAGDYTSTASFVSSSAADGIIQQWDRFAHGIGVTRAREISGAEAAVILPSRNSTAIQRLLKDAFDRLSENGRLRLADDLDSLKLVLQNGMELGQSPLVVARQMRDNFSSYSGWKFERLARTEIAWSQNTGMLDEYEAEGFDASGVKGDLAPFHPNCMCTYTIDLETRKVVYQISAQACELCQAYKRAS